MKCDALRKKTTRVNDSTDNVNLLLVTEYRKMLIDVRNDSFCRIMWRQHEPLPIGSSARCVMTMRWPFLRIACRYAVTHDVTLKDHHTQNYIYVGCLLILVLIYAAYVILCAMALSQGCALIDCYREINDVSFKNIHIEYSISTFYVFQYHAWKYIRLDYSYPAHFFSSRNWKIFYC